MPKPHGIRVETGTSVERLRLELGLNQHDFGKGIGVTAMTVSFWERGISAVPASAFLAMAKMARTKADHWVFLGMAGFSRAEFAVNGEN